MALLEATGVTKASGQLTALSEVDFGVEEGQLHGLIGPNGSGKSTLLKCIAGAELPSSGRIRFLGRDLTQATPSARARAGLSLKFQVTSVFPELSVYDNVLLALQAQNPLTVLAFSRTRPGLHARVMELLAELRLLDRGDDAAAVIPHREQQWLAMDIGLAYRRRLLLRDVPSTGMSLAERRTTCRRF